MDAYVKIVSAHVNERTSYLDVVDPQVNVTIGSTYLHTTALDNTQDPVWNTELGPWSKVSTTDASKVRFDLLDLDLGYDIVGSANISILEYRKISKTYSENLNITLTNVSFGGGYVIANAVLVCTLTECASRTPILGNCSSSIDTIPCYALGSECSTSNSTCSWNNCSGCANQNACVGAGCSWNGGCSVSNSSTCTGSTCESCGTKEACNTNTSCTWDNQTGCTRTGSTCTGNACELCPTEMACQTNSTCSWNSSSGCTPTGSTCTGNICQQCPTEVACATNSSCSWNQTTGCAPTGTCGEDNCRMCQSSADCSKYSVSCTWASNACSVATVVNEKISGTLSKRNMSSGVWNLELTGRGNATLEKNRNNSTFYVKGAALNLVGGDNTIHIDQRCTQLLLDCEFVFLISATKGAVSVRNCVFNFVNNWASFITANNTARVEIVACTVTGLPYQFALIENTTQLLISKCTFQNLKQQNLLPYVFNGFLLRLVSCPGMRLEDSTFTAIDAGTFQAGVTSAGGWAAPVYIEDCFQASVSGCKFENCSGWMAGAVFSFSAGVENVYKNLKFTGNKYTAPMEQVISLIEKVGGVYASLALEYIGDSLTLGNDVTRFGTQPLVVSGVCSDSAEPQFRNGVSNDNFARCTRKPFTLSTPMLVAIIAGSVGAVSLALIILCCCCCCKCCQACCCCCCIGCCRKSSRGEYNTLSEEGTITSKNSLEKDRRSHSKQPPQEE